MVEGKRRVPQRIHAEPCRACGGTLRYVDTRQCVPCKLRSSRASYHTNREEHIKQTNRWRAENPERHQELMRLGQLRRKFGITGEQYEQMRTAQGDTCAICRLPCPTGRRLAVDHDHTTKKVRGLLCQACNTGIGKLREDPARLRAAADYLESHLTIRSAAE